MINPLLRVLFAGALTVTCGAATILDASRESTMRSQASFIPVNVATAQVPSSRRDSAQPEQIDDLAQHFKALNVEGSILIYDLRGDRIYQHNWERNTIPFPPASTFKIPNSLIALETGVITDEAAILAWDGMRRSFPSWNRDLNMREAFKLSAVWFYQVLARQIGHERMQSWVAAIEYGNQTIGDAADIDTFWLKGDLQITPQEQMQFLRRLYDNDLPFAERTITIIKDIMITEQTSDYTIRAKTGWALESQIGWYVGYLERGEDVYFFVTNIDINEVTDPLKRIKLTRRCLETLGIL